MRRTINIAILASALGFATQGQTPGKTEFEVASVKTNAPQLGFHMAVDSISGGPGTADPGMFRCSRCSLATLIIKAFKLQPYQFPGRAALTENTYELQAKIPAGATVEEFSTMLQNLLQDRFSLTWHFQEKKVKGYRLVVARDGPKLKESAATPVPPAAGQHRGAQAESHNHSGAMVFGTSASFRAANQSTADLARILSDQTGLPVDDETGLTGKYDISLRWSGVAAPRPSSHTEGASGHAHDGGGGAAGDDASGPTLFDALQQQLGLKLFPAEQALTRLFIIDRVTQRSIDN